MVHWSTKLPGIGFEISDIGFEMLAFGENKKPFEVNPMLLHEMWCGKKSVYNYQCNEMNVGMCNCLLTYITTW